MKKLNLFLLASVFSLSAFAQNGWKLGITAGSVSSKSYYSGGMQEANARFHKQNYGSGMLGIVARKTINTHFSWQFGLKFNQIGFQYGIAENYSLLAKHDRHTITKIGLGTVNIPATLIYNTNYNCRNVRWFVGAGLSLTASGTSMNTTQTITPGESTSANSSTVVLSQTVEASSYTKINGHVMGGVEKQFKSGRMLSAAVYFNKGFSAVATSTVNYTIDGKDYTHTFTNYGSYAGLSLTYYFKPWESFKKKPKATTAKK